MYDRTNKPKTNAQSIQAKPLSKLLSLLSKQFVAACICLALILGMKNCGNSFMLNCANSLDKALRFDADIQTYFSTVSDWFKEHLLPDNAGEQRELPAKPQALPSDEISFQ